ncbi:MAG: hypothetical protein V3W18_05140 [candidate division Zixibacteria bacterium]
METRKIIILSLFAIVVIYGFYFHFLSGNGAFNNSNAGTPIVEAPEAVGRAANDLTLSKMSAISPGLSEVRTEEWKKDPFLNNRNYKLNTSANRHEEPTAGLKPRLSAISYSNGIWMAVVNGKVTRIGEIVGEWRLDEIAGKAARFRGPDGSIWIKLGG